MKLPALFLAMTVAVVTSVSAAAKTVVEVLDEAPNYKIFSSGMHAAGLAEEFMGEGPFTIFAPTDEAFAKLPPDMWPTLLKPENKAKLVSFVTHHIVPSKVVTEGLKDGPITTLSLSNPLLTTKVRMPMTPNPILIAPAGFCGKDSIGGRVAFPLLNLSPMTGHLDGCGGEPDRHGFRR